MVGYIKVNGFRSSHMLVEPIEYDTKLFDSKEFVQFVLEKESARNDGVLWVEPLSKNEIRNAELIRLYDVYVEAADKLEYQLKNVGYTMR